MAGKNYTIKTPLRHNGKKYAVGDKIQLSKAEAEEFAGLDVFFTDEELKQSEDDGSDNGGEE